MKRFLFLLLMPLFDISGTSLAIHSCLEDQSTSTDNSCPTYQIEAYKDDSTLPKIRFIEPYLSKAPSEPDDKPHTISSLKSVGLTNTESLKKPQAWFRKELFFSRDPYDPEYYLVDISNANEDTSPRSSLKIYHLDNGHLANEFQLITDPFLAYRTKVTKREEVHDFAQSIRASLGQQSLASLDYTEIDDSYKISFVNTKDVFSYEKPHFFLFCDSEIPKKVWWQISSSPSFDLVPSNLDQITDFNSKIEIDDMAETFLNPNEPYYIRLRGIQDEQAGPWSEPFKFFVQKPKRISYIEFNKIGKNKFELKWQKDDSPTTQYLIFASNSQDFIPSIYSDRHLLAFDQDHVESADNHNLIALTPSNRLEINGSFAYYRIIAIDHQQLSVPSDLVYIYDHDLILPRDRLVLSDQKEYLIERKLFDSANPYFLLKKTFTDYTSHPYISEETWQKVKPFLIPDNHPLNQPLNRIFHKRRVSQNALTLQKAGFKTFGGDPQSHSQTIFCRHENLKNYVLKIIPDDYPIDEVEKLRGRIIGAKAVKETINKYHFDHLVKVPQKWLYVLPPLPAPAPNTYRKNFILVADDMQIYDKETNYAMWKSFLMTPELLQAIYTIITEVGLDDCVYAFNLPFCRDGKIAFLDTEDHHRWPVHYRSLNKYLAPQTLPFWLQLSHQN